MRSTVLALVLGVVGLSTTDARAGVIHVPGDQPTLQAAVNAAAAFDVIEVAKGTYASFVVNAKADLTIRAKGKVLVDGGGVPAVTVSSSSRIVLEGLRVRADASVGVSVSSVIDLLLDGLRIENAGLAAIEVTSGQRVHVRNCVVMSAGTNGILLASDDSLVSGSKISNAAAHGIWLAGDRVTAYKTRVNGVGGHGIFVVGDDDAVERCTITDFAGRGVDVTGTKAVLRRNVVKGGALDGIRLGGNQATVVGNSIAMCDSIGIHAVNPDTTALENSVSKTGADGILFDASATGGIVHGNKTAVTGGDGIDIQADDVLLSENRVKKPGSGIPYVTDGMNVAALENK